MPRPTPDPRGPYLPNTTFPRVTLYPPTPSRTPTTHHLTLTRALLPFTQSCVTACTFSPPPPHWAPGTQAIIKFFDYRWSHLTRRSHHQQPAWTPYLDVLLHRHLTQQPLPPAARRLARTELALLHTAEQLYQDEKRAYSQISRRPELQGVVPRWYGTVKVDVAGLTVKGLVLEWVRGVALGGVAGVVGGEEAAAAARKAWGLVRGVHALGLWNADWHCGNLVGELGWVRGRRVVRRVVMIDFAHAEWGGEGEVRELAEESVRRFPELLDACFGKGWERG